MAQLPRDRAGALTNRAAGAAAGAGDGDRLSLAPPAPVTGVLATLIGHDHEAAIVGGSLRDVLLGLEPADWDVATSAPPETVHRLFPGSTWQNRFGTVTVRGDPDVQVTTYRSESGYSDRRRPDRVEWGTSLDEDLARRDFTINALAWLPDATAPSDAEQLPGTLRDPWGGAADLRAGTLRAVGDPDRRFEEDALRLLRAVRFATRFGLTLEASTEAAIRRHAGLAANLSGERVRDEIMVWLRSEDPPPSRYVVLAESLGLLASAFPELAALRGVPQAKALPGDALDHSLRTVDALPATDPMLRLAGLLHDLGKATTLKDGHFYGHEQVGAQLAARALERLRLPRDEVARICGLIRQHMFAYDASWTDAAVRRFVKRVTREQLPRLFALRRADNLASGASEPRSGGLDELAARIANEDRAPLDHAALAIDGHDLMEALDLRPGPQVGRLLDELLERVIEDPGLNRRQRLLDLAAELRDAPTLTERTGH